MKILTSNIGNTSKEFLEKKSSNLALLTTLRTRLDAITKGGSQKARVDSSQAATVAAHNSLGIAPIYTYGTEEQKQRFLPMPTSDKKLWAFGRTEQNAGYMLMQPGTLSIIEKVREFRNDSGCRIGSTLEAGANVHLLHASADAEKVERFITSELVPFCEDGRMIMDQMGKGPSKLKT